ncbi:type II toxin-antitoxin system RelE/ParE family toxin [Rouxiella sp. Mn2063]|uniref:type II toxin-antitoxin system RelE/ParE family toxin n=1 Tax=Rouxiella sp. Mn2063 TaxID=3395262 RepID=UPI003BE9DFF9
MWEVITTECFDIWFEQQSERLQERMLAGMHLLFEDGPNLSRPHVDTLENSHYLNMKELRVQHEGHPIRAFFAFDPKRCAIMLCAGDKTGKKEKQFYKDMVRTADTEFEKHLNNLEQ